MTRQNPIYQLKGYSASGRAKSHLESPSALTKPNPDHLQVVGPRFAGKTVILHELARQLVEMGTPYSAVIIWDLGHQTPETDELFMRRLAQELSVALRPQNVDYSDHLKNVQESAYQDIAEILDLLSDEKAKILVIMDGFDKPLSNGQLTRNLWDQLRELALKPSLRLVTASRRTLRDLIRHPDAQTSDFWNIFDPSPVRVGCFNEDDFNNLLSHIPDTQLEQGAKTEIWNSSNGFPIIMLEILNKIYEEGISDSINIDNIRAACNNSYTAIQDWLSILWTDCSTSAHDAFRLIQNSGGSLSRNGMPNVDVDALIEHGFAYQSNNKLVRPNRMLTRFLDDQPNDNSALGWLFKAEEGYNKHFNSVLEHRLNQIYGIDPTIKRYLANCIRDLPDYPDILLSHIRGVVDQAFNLIWQAELSGRTIPSGWMSIWRSNNERGVDNWLTTFPQGGQRVRLLKLMTGFEKSAPVARYVKKGTATLMDNIQSFGDFGQHQEGAPIYLGTAYAALHLCIELAASLTHELHLASSE